MKKTLKYSVAAIAAGALAIGIMGCGGWHHGRHCSPEKAAGFAVKRISSKLDLNDAQRAKLEAIKDEALVKFKEAHGDRDAAHQQAIDLVKKDRLNGADIDKLFTEREEQMKKLKPFVIEKLVEFHAMLTPAQRVKLAELMKEHHGRCPQ
jgi:periplasmic protein CpxP/Spy